MKKTYLITTLLVTALALVLATRSAHAAGLQKISYIGNWEIQPNGDVKVRRVFTLQAMVYKMWKDNNIHMREMRTYNPTISAIEADDLEFAWDDVKRTLTLTMTVRGMAINQGDRWEAAMTPGLEFSNIDTSQKKAFFHAVNDVPGGTIIGQDIVAFPATATNIELVDGRVLHYVLPDNAAATETAKSNGPLWWSLFAAALVVGLAMLAVSGKVGKPAPAA